MLSALGAAFEFGDAEAGGLAVDEELGFVERHLVFGFGTEFLGALEGFFGFFGADF